MKEILDVQSEINDIQEEIEAADGRVNYLKHSAAYSTVNLNYYQYINGTSSDNAKPGFLKEVSNAFVSGTAALGELLLFMISIWPFLAGIIVFWIFIKRFRIKKA
jgi:tetrahydromethanopterin S-methyltransferase subunit B